MFRLILLLTLVLLIPVASSQTYDTSYNSEHVIYTYDYAMNTQTLLSNGSTLLGDYFYVVPLNHNLTYSVSLDGVLYFNGNGTFKTKLLSPHSRG